MLKVYSPVLQFLNVLRIIENLLLNDAVPAERTKLSVADIMSALKLCLLSTIFTFKNVLYLQICGAPMGLAFHLWLPIVLWSMLNAKLLLPSRNTKNMDTLR